MYSTYLLTGKQFRGLPLALFMAAAVFFNGSRSFAQEPQALVQPVPEYSVKAAYLLLFARYVHWPETAFVNSDAPLVIAIVGRDPFGTVLDATLRDQRIGARAVQLVRVPMTRASLASLQAHLVFIAESQYDEQQWLSLFRARPILTVCESASALESGAIVRLFVGEGRVRFDVDWAASARANLKIASPMLVSARLVRGAPAEQRNGLQP